MVIIVKKVSGVTLIEVLLALIVLAIGVLGVLALFPSAISTNNASAQDVMAANLAASVEQALMTGMANATWNYTYQTYQIALSHDLNFFDPNSTGVGGGQYYSGLYNFLLPTIIYDGGLPANKALLLPSINSAYYQWHRHPASVFSPLPYPVGNAVNSASSETTSPPQTPIDPQKSSAFTLTGDGWVNATVVGVQNATMGYSEPYEQYMFSFDAIKLNRVNNSWLGAVSSSKYFLTAIPDNSYEYTNKFYEFKIHILRASGGATGAASSQSNASVPKVRILTVPLKIAVRTLK